ncbi:HlyD family secretion protein [Tellurirhabdus rosea]|uniref:HlyD family secretion protein n=1 Tax=Tellurirhabdus rosea TaxID=2674997 RepID=UPI00225128E1|nr:HlyD family efflux transporter periplasmic adaptor subunit [Tellurirhabdus rosea]
MLNISRQRVEDVLEEKYPLEALETLQTPRTGRIFARWLTGILLIMLVALFLPWQQNINGEGFVSALRPQDRPQTIQNAIAGQISKWFVQEGQLVRKGDTLAVISEIKDEYFDPNLPQRLREQLVAKQNSIVATQAKIEALNSQIAALKDGLTFKLQSARNKVRQGQFKVTSDSTDVVAVRSFYVIAKTRQERFENGYKNGLFSLTDVETRRLKLQEDYAKVISQENKLSISRNELINARIELSSVQADYQDKISKAQSDLGSAISYLADARSELAKLQNKISSVDVRRGLYVIRAPQDGYIVKAAKAGIGETIKEGESIATLQPAEPQVAVELFVNANDVPLIERGRTVRLEFDGWPALQFSGWPSVAVGTFGGKVSVIDAVNSPNGKYRLLITPADNDQSWPKQLRLGSGVYGWVMLNDVPVWYEIWRQLNGFPPSLNQEPKIEEGGKVKK